MNILLVRPSPPKETLGLKSLMICEPLELETLAGALEGYGHEVYIIDEILGDDTASAIRDFNPAVLGTSAYITGVGEVQRICRIAKRHNPDILTLTGGVHATIIPEDYHCDEIDIIVRGEGTSAFQEIVSQYGSLTGSGKAAELLKDKCRKIAGLDFRYQNRWESTPDRAFNPYEFENRPLPRRDLVARHRARYYYLYHRPVTIIRTSYGCPFRCDFCFCWRAAGGRYYRRSPESVVRELESIETDEVYIIDDTFLIDEEYLSSLARLIREKNLRKSYLVYGRSDFIANHPQVIADWAALGLKAVIVGLEYTSNEELEAVNKHTSREINDRSIDVLRLCRVDVYGSFILDPLSDEKAFRKLGDYIADRNIFYVVLQPLTPLPGTLLHERMKDELTVPADAYPLWDMSHLVVRSSMTAGRFYRKMIGLYIRTSGNPWRFRKLQLRTAPPLLSRDFARLTTGAYRVVLSLLSAHKHLVSYKRRLLREKAQDEGL
jgi:radical SAM superfamily enzyme YgiQ (UPF0313 family)